MVWLKRSIFQKIWMQWSNETVHFSPWYLSLETWLVTIWFSYINPVIITFNWITPLSLMYCLQRNRPISCTCTCIPFYIKLWLKFYWFSKVANCCLLKYTCILYLHNFKTVQYCIYIWFPLLEHCLQIATTYFYCIVERENVFSFES